MKMVPLIAKMYSVFLRYLPSFDNNNIAGVRLYHFLGGN